MRTEWKVLSLAAAAIVGVTLVALTGSRLAAGVFIACVILVPVALALNAATGANMLKTWGLLRSGWSGLSRGRQVGSLVVLALVAWIAVAYATGYGQRGNQPAYVIYHVFGTGVADVTYANGEGGTKQQTVSLPWFSPSVPVHWSQQFSLDAQLSGEGSIECQIETAGYTVADNTSTGYQAVCNSVWHAP
jgi:hypothetical protein